ncbi:probable cytochrome P450 49a1 [Procambarus clarkii]|uniref:probable cytochrome P450 49a1 n=1 Tax=Procambarus clarkii TaxID=6728 RepID=UPI003742D259
MRQVSSLSFSSRMLAHSCRRAGRRSCYGHVLTLPCNKAEDHRSMMEFSHVSGENFPKNTTTTDREILKSLRPSHAQLIDPVIIGSQDRSEPRPFASIPGPKPLPVIGNTFLFTSIGGYPLERFWESSRKLFEEYGPVVRIAKLAGDVDMVMVFQPEDTRRIFKAEGQYPVRPGLDILKHYRSRRPQWFTSPGLVPGNGPEWRRLRSAIHSLLRPEVVSRYRATQNDVAKDLVGLLREHTSLGGGGGPGDGHRQQSRVVKDLLPLLFRYTLEAVGVVSLGTRLGCLDDAHAANTTRAQRVISSNMDTLRLLGKSIFSPPLYKVFPTPSYQRLAAAQDTIARIVQEEVLLRQAERASDPHAFSSKHPFLDSLLTNSNLSPSDVFLLLAEVFQGGIDATATTLAFCVYFLARDQRTQDLLLQEVKDVDPATHSLQGLVYLRAVVQETLRLRPSASSRSRVIQEDTVFSGYLVPKGTYVTSPPVVSCHDPGVFPEPELFRPERWIPGSTPLDVASTHGKDGMASGSKIHPFTVLAFGHGARMCPGRRLAEQEIKLALIQLVQCFKMEVENTTEDVTIGQVMRLNMMPEKPFAIRFIPRNNTNT